jgi:excinuclease UvrABC helicase subunit UvrB
MYADKITASMQKTIDGLSQNQINFNLANNQGASSLNKKIESAFTKIL